MLRIPGVIAALLLITSSAQAICNLNVRFVADPPSLVWDAIPGVKTIQVQESFDNFKNSRNYFVTTSPFLINHRASADMELYYTVTAIMQSNVLSVQPLVEGCTDQLIVKLKGDPAFRALTRRSVVPVAGSGPGANGAQFKTSLRLTSTTPNERGRIVFHPAGTPGHDTDPWRPYRFGGIGEEMFIADIVDSLGRTGLGSIDIVPDEGAADTVPRVEARMYNDTPAGTFGTASEALLPYDFLTPAAFTMTIHPATEQFRFNVGLRTLAPVRGQALIYGTNGRLRDFVNVSYPADYMILGTARQLLGIDLAEGEGFTLQLDGAAIPFYTRTENRTNDPELFVVRPARSTSVSSYVE